MGLLVMAVRFLGAFNEASVYLSALSNTMLPAPYLENTIVRVFAGMSLGHWRQYGGNVPDITLWDEMGEFWGQKNGKGEVIGEGAGVDTYIHGVKGVRTRRPGYISVTNGGTDALCVSALTITFPDGESVAWYGDMGAYCGAHWYESYTIVGSNEYSPKCIWIDRDKSLPHMVQGFSFHIRDFIATEERVKLYNDTSDLACSAPRFSLHKHSKIGENIPMFWPPLEYDKYHRDVDLDKVLFPKAARTGKGGQPGLVGRSSSTFQAARRRQPGQPVNNGFGHILVRSNMTSHSANRLCGSTTSYGPDFVSVPEQVFCDMTTKQTWPVCSQTNAADTCFDVESSQLRHLPGSARISTPLGDQDAAQQDGPASETPNVAHLAARAPLKTYSQVLDWE